MSDSEEQVTVRQGYLDYLHGRIAELTAANQHPPASAGVVTEAMVEALKRIKRQADQAGNSDAFNRIRMCGDMAEKALTAALAGPVAPATEGET